MFDKIGIDIEIKIIFPPKSIFEAKALSPQSIHIEITYSNIIEIAVSFNNIFIKSTLYNSKEDISFIKFIISLNDSKLIDNINILATNII